MRCHGLKIPDHSLIDTNRDSFILFTCMLTSQFTSGGVAEHAELFSGREQCNEMSFTSVFLALLKHK